MSKYESIQNDYATNLRKSMINQTRRFIEMANEVQKKEDAALREEIIRMAREAGFDDYEQDEMLLRFAALVADRMIRNGYRKCAEGQRTTQFCGQLESAVAGAVAAEREACAKVCDEQGVGRKALEHYAALTYSGAAHDCAAAIRARGEK